MYNKTKYDKKQNKMLTNGTGIEETMKAIERASEYAQPVLKRDWERVKSGELPFRIARNWVAPAIVVLSLLFIAWVVVGQFR